jgi:anti-sigma regulatory factor (Ser/Thr protein kinase)
VGGVPTGDVSAVTGPGCAIVDVIGPWPKRDADRVIGTTVNGYASGMSSRPSAAATPAQLTLAGSADAVTAAQLRRTLRQWLHQVARMPSVTYDDIVLGANEALANCVEHAYRERRSVGTMELQALYDPAAQSVRVCVRDRGIWYRRTANKSNDPRRSRGIMLMHALADHCSIDTRPSGTTVCLDYGTDDEGASN